MATPPSTVRQRPAYSSRPTSPTLESPDIPHPRPPPLGLSASKDLPKVGHKSPAVPSQSIPPSPSHIPPPPKSSLLGLAQLPILLLTAVVLVPSFIELASRYSNIYQAAPLAGARAVLPKAWEKDAGIVGEQGGNGGYGGIGDPGRERERRQTIADMSVPVDEYKWGGEGNGTEICKRWSHQCMLPSCVYLGGRGCLGLS